MRIAHIIHNPKAGVRTHSRDAIINLVESGGYQCRYTSTKEDNWFDIQDDVDFIIAAGGDGTIRKVLEKLIKKGVQYPVALLPLGTANNIAGSLGISGSDTQIAESWQHATITEYNIGSLGGLEKTDFFVESAGAGLFPGLIAAMKKEKKLQGKYKEDKLLQSLHCMAGLVDACEPVACELVLDGQTYSGKYLMVEVMNISRLGPGLPLNPMAKVNDETFEVILIPEEQRAMLSSFIQLTINGIESIPPFKTVTAKSISITCHREGYMHIDDILVKKRDTDTINMEVHAGKCRLLV